MDETARQRARGLVHTPEFAKAQRERKKVEALFAELKNQIGLRRLRLRRLKFVREQFSWQPWPRTSSDWCGSSANRQLPQWKLPRSLVRSKNSAAADNEANGHSIRTFSTPQAITLRTPSTFSSSQLGSCLATEERLQGGSSDGNDPLAHGIRSATVQATRRVPSARTSTLEMCLTPPTLSETRCYANYV